MVLAVDLVGVHDVLPDDVGRRGDRRDRVEERLGHPDGQHRVLLSERLPARRRIAVAAAQCAARLELREARYYCRFYFLNTKFTLFGKAT